MLVNLSRVLGPAKAGRYAVGLFNTVTLEQTEGIFEAAEELRAPIIVGTAERFTQVISLETAADLLIRRAERASVPVAVYFDHGFTYENCMKALRLGFSSVMYDGSALPYAENVARLAEVVKAAHAMGATVEGELGHVGGSEGGMEVSGEEVVARPLLTDPALAAEFVRRTGVDALAIAVGNAHGAYSTLPKLDFQRIERIAGLVEVPLVLHGGSGLLPSDFRLAIRKGIRKVNVFTDIDIAAAMAAKAALNQGNTSMLKIAPIQVEAVKQVVKEKIQLFGSAGKADDSAV